MAESNAAQVILTDDGLKIIKAQNTADEAVSGVDKINDSNQLGPAEKQTLQRKYQADKLVYDMDIKMLTDAGLPTAELQSTMTALNSFITPYFQNMGKTEQVDRDQLNQVFNNFDTADKNASNAFNSMVSNAAKAAKEAGDDAQEAGEAAKQAAGQAQTDATAAKQKAQEVISTVNNMTISNRNLALGTATAFTLIGNGLANQSVTAYNFAHSISAGTTITLAMDIVSSTSNGTFKLVFPAISNVGGYWEALTQSAPLSTSVQHIVKTYKVSNSQVAINLQLDNADGVVKISNFIISESSKEVNWTPAPEDLATVTDITASIGNIHLGVKNADGSTSTFNMNDNTILMDTAQTIISGKTSILDGTIVTAKIADAAINSAKIADAAINDAKIANLDAGKITTGIMDASHINVDQLIANGINGKTITGITINTPNLHLGDNGQIVGNYSVNDDTGWFQPINGTGTLQISNGYIRSTANIIYYNKILNGIDGDKWGHWASSTQFVPAPDQAHPDTGNIAESTFTPAFLKLDIFEADKSKVNSRVYIDGTGLYINDGGTQAISAMLSDYELVSSGMAYLNSGIQMKQAATFTFGNLAMNGYHSISMLDGNALNFTDNPHVGANPIEITAKTFTKASRLSIKHDIKPLSTAESSRLLNAIDIEKFRYTHDGATYKYQYGGVIDDVNSLGSKQYSMPPELLSEDGTGINLDSLTGILVKRVQDQDKTIAELSMRLTKLEMEK